MGEHGMQLRTDKEKMKFVFIITLRIQINSFLDSQLELLEEIELLLSNVLFGAHAIVQLF